MSANGDSHSHGNHDVRFEESDVSTRPIALAVLVLAVFTLVFTGIAHLYFHYLATARQEVSGTNPVAGAWHLGDYGKAAEHAAGQSAAQVPAPRLQIDPKADLEALRASEAKALGSWGWVDQQAGLAHVPIEKAKQMLLAKGLPARDGAVPKKMAPHAYSAPAQSGEGAGAPDWFGGAAIGYEGSGEHGGHDGGGHAPAGHAATGGHAAASEAHGH